MSEIYKEQKRHVACIQDPDDIGLFTQVGITRKIALIVHQSIDPFLLNNRGMKYCPSCKTPTY